MPTEANATKHDWEEVLLDSVAKRGSGHTPDKKHPEYWGGPIKWISLQDSAQLDALYIEDTAATITVEGIKNSSAVLHQKGTVVLSRDAGVGKSAIMAADMAVSQHFMAWTCGQRLDNHFLYYWLQSKKPEFERIANGNTIKTIGLPYFKDLSIPLPPPEEQKRIASAMSGIDTLISSLDQLIVKKRNIQQATMQQLLTGQRRLPGFSGEWVVKRLGEIGEVSGAGVDKKIRTGETEIRLLNYTDVYKKDFLRSSDFNHVVTAKPEQIARCAVKKGDVFFTPSSETRDDIGHASVSCEDMPDVTYSYHVVRLRPLPALDIKFLGFVFKSKDFSDQASVACEGSGTRYVITLPKFRAMTIHLPLGIDEQEAIGEVLFDMGNELAALETRRDKARQLKQGMMQELLTGRIRLTSSALKLSPSRE